MAELSSHVIRICGAIVILFVAGEALGRIASILSIGVALGARCRDMSAGQRKRGAVVIECGRLPG